jgi:CopG family nickel-responsive transcriptional regulator
MASPGTLYEWIETLPEDGRYMFSRAEAEDVTDASDAAIKMTLYRLKKSGAIVSPRRDFFVVVPREYRSAGSPPASWFIDDLIRARLLEEEWDKGAGEALASVTLLYDHSKRKLSRQIEEHGHDHHDVVLSSMHIHVSPHVCLEVVVLRGQPDDVRHVANHLIGLPGVLHGRAVYSRADLPEALT